MFAANQVPDAADGRTSGPFTCSRGSVDALCCSFSPLGGCTPNGEDPPHVLVGTDSCANGLLAETQLRPAQ